MSTIFTSPSLWHPLCLSTRPSSPALFTRQESLWRGVKMDGRVINMELVHSVSTGPIPNHMYTRPIDRSLVLNHLLQRWIKFVWTCTNLSTKTRLSLNWILGCIFAMLLTYNIHVLKFKLYLFETCAKHQRKLNDKIFKISSPILL